MPIITPDIQKLKRVNTGRISTTGLPLNLCNGFIELAIMEGMTQKEALMAAMCLFYKKIGKVPPKFKEKAELYAKMAAAKRRNKK